MAIRDKTGAPFDGSKNYRLTVPANSPVKQYWSAVVYDRATHALIRNASRLSRSSQNPDLQKNTDGSVDVYFGPKAPAGKQTNWIPTNPGGKFEVLFRLYGPESRSSTRHGNYRTSKRSSEVQGRYRHKGGAPASTTTATPSGVSGEEGRYSAPGA